MKTPVYDALSRLVAIEESDGERKANCVRLLSYGLLVTKTLPDGTVERIDPSKFYKSEPEK